MRRREAPIQKTSFRRGVEDPPKDTPEFHRGKRSSTGFLKECLDGFSSAHLVLTLFLIVFLAPTCAESQNALERDQSVLNAIELATAASMAPDHSATP